mmetsp:Transcript_63155/g.179573  ORF Transcript_63155/g.179573 Transcript_63155/m.179573 type:complete len:221 (-) Transcript_63155:1262-1924(-)
MSAHAGAASATVLARADHVREAGHGLLQQLVRRPVPRSGQSGDGGGQHRPHGPHGRVHGFREHLAALERRRPEAGASAGVPFATRAACCLQPAQLHRRVPVADPRGRRALGPAPPMQASACTASPPAPRRPRAGRQRAPLAGPPGRRRWSPAAWRAGRRGLGPRGPVRGCAGAPAPGSLTCAPPSCWGRGGAPARPRPPLAGAPAMPSDDPSAGRCSAAC